MRHEWSSKQERNSARSYVNHHKGPGKRAQAKRNRRQAKLAIKKAVS